MKLLKNIKIKLIKNKILHFIFQLKMTHSINLTPKEITINIFFLHNLFCSAVFVKFIHLHLLL